MCIKTFNDAEVAAINDREELQSQSGLRMSKKSKAGPADGRKTVFLVDRHALMRRAAAGWVNRCSGLRVCGMAGGMAEAFRSISRLRPDVVVSEIMRPQDLGFIRELHRRHPRLPILVFTIQDAAVYAPRAREAGASGYLMKDAGGDQFVRSIRAALRRLKGRSARRRPRKRPVKQLRPPTKRTDQRLTGEIKKGST